MRVERDDRDTGEPEGGWAESSKRLYDTEIITITLCRFTGLQLDPTVPVCAAREAAQHADVDCAMIFLSATALQRGELDVSKFDEIPAEIRVPFGGAGEPTGVT